MADARAKSRDTALPSFSPEPLRVQCVRYIAANIESVDSLDGVDEESAVAITGLILHALALTPVSATKLRATGHFTVLEMLKPYSALRMIPDPPAERPCDWKQHR